MKAGMKCMYLEEAESLLRQAADCIKYGEPEKAVWRAVDGIGHVVTAINAWQEKNIVGVTVPTGRGYQLVQATPPTVVVTRVTRAKRAK